LVREQIWVSFLLELLMAAFCLFLGFAQSSLNVFIVYSLVLACLIAARLLVALLEAPVWLSWACALVCVVTAFFYGQDVFLALLALIVFNVVGVRFNHNWALGVSGVVSLLLGLVFAQVTAGYLGLVAGLLLAYFGYALAARLARERRELLAKDEQIAVLAGQLENQRAAINAIEQQGRQAERNRLAARIHDKVGHGMTGSILMLEAAQLQMDKDPVAAAASIQRATENLRDSVDEIRRELREERGLKEGASLVRIADTLQEFSVSHEGIRTELVTEGELLDSIPQAIWLCIYENLQETLTNLLKHSSGDSFKVLVSLQNRLVYVEFSDNGRGYTGAAERESAFVARQGMGLAGIEERTLLHGGKAFFVWGPEGFKTRMTFALRGQL